MANSITLSQSLVDDISQKITDGTATAEQVVLYTKGLNQLQTGNDFQAVVIGLSQSAVDAIDSANSQFQEDSQTALDTFSATASRIDTSATNAVSAINTAKDTLVATDAEITTTINALPGKSSVEESITFITEKDQYGQDNDAPKWDGPHPLPKNFKPHNPGYPERVIDHPWKSAAFLRVNRRGYTTYDPTVSLYNHEMQKIDEVGVHNSDITYTVGASANIQDHLMPSARYQYWEMVHNYGIYSTEETAASSDRNNPGVTGYMDHYGIGRHTFNPKAWAGLHPGNFLLSTNYTGSSERVTYGGSITSVVGTCKRDFIMSRPYNGNMLYMHATQPGNFATYSRMKRPNRRAESDYWTTNRSHNTFQNWGKFDHRTGDDNNYPGDIQYHDRLRFTDYHNSGYGLTAFNANTNKFAYIETEANGTSYNWNPKLYTINQGKDLRDICLGRVEVSGYDVNPVSEGIMTLQIDSDLDFKTASQDDKAVNNYSTYDRYHGKVVLCDNDTMIISTPYDHSHSPKGLAIRRIVKNSANDGYEYDAMKWWDGSTPYTSADYGGGIVSVTNDGKYAALFHSYYYYGAGISGALIRVSDGAMLPFRYTDTSRGFNAIPIKHDKFIFSRQYASNAHHQMLADCDYLFAKHADMTDVTNDIFGGNDHQEYDYVKFNWDYMDRQGYTASGTSMGIYNPYNYLFEYYNADGTRKSNYDRNLNLITT